MEMPHYVSRGCLVWHPPAANKDPVLVWCLSSIYDSGPTLNRCWVNISCLLVRFINMLNVNCLCLISWCCCYQRDHGRIMTSEKISAHSTQGWSPDWAKTLLLLSAATDPGGVMQSPPPPSQFSVPKRKTQPYFGFEISSGIHPWNLWKLKSFWTLYSIEAYYYVTCDV